jgi:hypothetical protein
MSTYGDFRLGDIGGGFHSGIDITQSAPNNSADGIRTPLKLRGLGLTSASRITRIGIVEGLDGEARYQAGQ